MNFDACWEALDQTPFKSSIDILQHRIKKVSHKKHGNLPVWNALLQQLPLLKVSTLKLNQSVVTMGDAADAGESILPGFRKQLKDLMPWRKGPYQLFGIDIDTEWRSDWKWDRLSPHIKELSERHVLDIGCGNGYHCWRMAGAGARFVLGIDPYLLFFTQYQVLKKYAPSVPVHLLPLGVESLPDQLTGFDTVFSMGVLYHRRSPLDHLIRCRDLLRPGGELVLETLIIDNGGMEVLVPEDRYAKMRNVWFIPAPRLLERWLQRAGFEEIRIVDVSRTTEQEQRATEWMQFESLADYLDPLDPTLTIEGYPGPVRAVFLASKPL